MSAIQMEETQADRIKRLELEYLEKSFRFQEEANNRGLVLGEDGKIHDPNFHNPVQIVFWIVSVLIISGFSYLIVRFL